MKCPKCGYFGPDYLDTCKKCGKDLVAEKQKLGLSSFRAQRPTQPRQVPKKAPLSTGLLSEEPASSPPPKQESVQTAATPPPATPHLKPDDTPAASRAVPPEKPEKHSPGETDEGFVFEPKEEEVATLVMPEEEGPTDLSRTKTDDFEFPPEFTKKAPPFNGLSQEGEDLAPSLQESETDAQEKVPDETSTDSSAGKNKAPETTETELITPQELEEILQTKPSEEAPPEKAQTELLDDDEIASLLEDIDSEPSEPNKSS